MCRSSLSSPRFPKGFLFANHKDIQTTFTLHSVRGQSIQPSCFSPASARPSNESRGKGAPGGFGPRDLGPKTGHFELSLSPQPGVCGFDCDDAELCKRLTKNIIHGSSLCDICSNEDLILLKEIVMAGPATVRMVRVNPRLPAPLPLPLHVPPGHIVQQIVDEHGVLRHLILSPQQPPQYPHLPPFPPGMPPPQHQPNYNCKARRFHQRMSSQTGSGSLIHLCQLITTCAMVATAQ